MNKQHETGGAGVDHARLVSSVTVLTLFVVLAFPVFGWYGLDRHGRLGLVAAGVAAMACWLGSFVALLIIGLARDSRSIANAILGGMVFRLGIPFGVGFLLMRQGGPLADAGVFGMILVFYLLTLPVETLLSLRFASPKASRTT